MVTPEQLRQPSDDLWRDLSLEPGLPRFLLQRADEMLDERSSEEFRPRVTNYKSLLVEFLSVSRAAKAHEPSRYYANSLMQEWLRATDRERELGLAIPSKEDPQVKALQTAVGGARFDDAAGIAANLLNGGLESEYLPAVRTAILAELEKWEAAQDRARWPKQPAAALLELWVTELVCLGHSHAALREHLLSVIVGSVTQPFPSRLKSALQSLPRPFRQHTVVLALRGRFEAAPGGAADLTLMPAGEAVNHAEWRDRLGLIQAQHGATLAEITVTARDRWAAAQEALGRGERALSIVQFARAGQPYSVEPQVVVEVAGDRHQVLVPRSRAFTHRPSQKAGAVWWQVAHRITSGNDMDSRWIESSLRHHRLSCTSDAVEGRLINLWISFEALFRGDDEAIVERVAGSVSRMIASSYLRSSLKGLASILMSRSPPSQKKTIRKSIPRVSSEGDATRIEPLELALVLSSPKDDPRINALYDAISGNELLCFRVAELRQVLARPKAFAEKMQRTQQTIDWQLRRIYRARNLIVHSGDRPSLTDELIRHAQHYLSVVVMQVIHDMGNHVGVALADSIRQRRLSFEHQLGALKGANPPSYTRLTEPWAWCRPDRDQSLWEIAKMAASTPPQSKVDLATTPPVQDA